jgi:PAS domain S-box-containing protein
MSGDERIFSLVKAYTLFEDAITSHPPPATLKKLSREELRQEIRTTLRIRELPEPLRLLFLEEREQAVTLFDLTTRAFGSYLLANVGLPYLQDIVGRVTKDTRFANAIRLEGPETAASALEASHESSLEEITSTYRELFRNLYAETVRLFGERTAHESAENIFRTIRENYDYEITSLFLTIMPEGLFERERLTFLSREELERRAEAAVAERLRREVAEKTAAELAATVADLNRTKTAMLNLLEDARLLEEKLREERDRLETILASMGEGLFVVDREGRVSMMNRTAETLLDIPIREAIGKPLTSLLFFRKGQAHTVEDVIGDVLRSGKGISAHTGDNFSIETTQGKTFPVAFIVTPLRGEGVIGAVAVFSDVTEQRKLDEAKTAFISTASHQLRTPLTSIRWFCELLMNEEFGTLTEQQRHFAERIYQAVERMVSLVNLLLQIARVEAGRVRVEPIQIDLKDLTEDIVQSLKDAFGAKRQRVEIHATPDPLPKVPLDLDIIWQVIMNLLTNANRYSPPDSLITVSITAREDLFEYAVHDRGIGIPKGEQGRIFEKFFRASNAVKFVPEGSGLGLALVKSLVEDWGGTITFESEAGQGTTFRFTIPRQGVKPRAGEVKLAV